MEEKKEPMRRVKAQLTLEIDIPAAAGLDNADIYEYVFDRIKTSFPGAGAPYLQYWPLRERKK